MILDAATAYACVAYRVMEYDGVSLSEEELEVILEMLLGFYNEWEIQKIYQQNIVFGSNDAILNEGRIKEKKGLSVQIRFLTSDSQRGDNPIESGLF